MHRVGFLVPLKEVIATYSGSLSPAVTAFIADLMPGARIEPLGGWMSTNLRLRSGSADLVMRVHDPSVSRSRLQALQRLRGELAARDVLVPTAIRMNGATVHSCDGALVEFERYIPHETVPNVPANFPWLFEVMGNLHAQLRNSTLPLPRPVQGHWLSPGTLRRWIDRSVHAAVGNPEALCVAVRARRLIRRVERHWPRPPRQIVHGDIKTENIARGPDGRTVHFDFGAAAYRPRIHDLAFTFVHTVTVAVDRQPLETQLAAWSSTPALVRRYEATSGRPLTDLEREALGPYTAAVRLFYAAAAHRFRDAAEALIEQGPAVDAAEWILDHPRALTD